MTEHYIKTKYKVRFTQEGDHVLFQREDDRFVFLSEDRYPECEEFVGRKVLERIDTEQTADWDAWIPEAKTLIQRALSGDLKPFWTCENKTEENICTCSIQDLWNFGC